MATLIITPTETERNADEKSKTRAHLSEVVRWSGYELAIHKHWPPLNIYPKKVGLVR